MSNKESFIQKCSQKLYPKSFARNKEKIVFEFCYLPNNIENTTEELAETLNYRYFDGGQRKITPVRVSQLRTDVAKRIVEEFEDEMIADGVKLKKLKMVVKEAEIHSKSLGGWLLIGCGSVSFLVGK